MFTSRLEWLNKMVTSLLVGSAWGMWKKEVVPERKERWWWYTREKWKSRYKKQFLVGIELNWQFYGLFCRNWLVLGSIFRRNWPIGSSLVLNSQACVCEDTRSHTCQKRWKAMEASVRRTSIIAKHLLPVPAQQGMNTLLLLSFIAIITCAL